MIGSPADASSASFLAEFVGDTLEVFADAAAVLGGDGFGGFAGRLRLARRLDRRGIGPVVARASAVGGHAAVGLAAATLCGLLRARWNVPIQADICERRPPRAVPAARADPHLLGAHAHRVEQLLHA